MTTRHFEAFGFVVLFAIVILFCNIHYWQGSLGYQKHTNRLLIKKSIRQLYENDRDDSGLPKLAEYNVSAAADAQPRSSHWNFLNWQWDKFVKSEAPKRLATDGTPLSALSNVMCAPGDHVGCYFRDRLETDGLPIIHSAFIDTRENQIVMIGVQRENETDTWENGKLLCVFHDRPAESKKVLDESVYSRRRHIKPDLVTVSDPIVPDERTVGATHQGLFVITCPIPLRLRNRTSLVFDFLEASTPDVSYERIKVCRNGQDFGEKKSTNRMRELVMCTMVKNMNHFVPDWLEYHRHLGVDHVYIYDNAVRSTLVDFVQSFITEGFLTVVPWAHSVSREKTYLETQIASENDCIWRHRHGAEWIIKIDVDEFLQPLDPARPRILDYLNTSFFQSTLGTVRIQNWFFCPHPEEYGPPVIGSKVFERNAYRSLEPTPVNRGRDKTIVNPVNVHYFKIHGAKLGAPSLTLSPYSEIRMVHYRGDNPRHRGFCPPKLAEDTSMVELWNKFRDRQKE